jgi:signal transduction histidine kinase
MVTSSLARTMLPEEQRRKVSLLQRAAKRMERLVDDLLEFGRIEAGALDLHPSLEQASAIVDDAVRLIQPAAAERGITFEVSVNDFSLRCARNRIVKVLEGLGSLATRTTPRDGRIRLRAESCDGCGRFSIEHDVLGGGDAERHNGAAAAPSLVLVVAKGIARAHDGELEVEHVAGGSRLVVTLPLEGPRLVAPDRSPGPAVPAASS